MRNGLTFLGDLIIPWFSLGLERETIEEIKDFVLCLCCVVAVLVAAVFLPRPSYVTAGGFVVLSALLIWFGRNSDWVMMAVAWAWTVASAIGMAKLVLWDIEDFVNPGGPSTKVLLVNLAVCVLLLAFGHLFGFFEVTLPFAEARAQARAERQRRRRQKR